MAETVNGENGFSKIRTISRALRDTQEKIHLANKELQRRAEAKAKSLKETVYVKEDGHKTPEKDKVSSSSDWDSEDSEGLRDLERDFDRTFDPRRQRTHGYRVLGSRSSSSRGLR